MGTAIQHLRYFSMQDLQQQVETLRRSPEGQQVAPLQNENAELRLELDMKQRQLEAASQGGAAAPQQVAARPLAAADLPALDTGVCCCSSSLVLLDRTAACCGACSGHLCGWQTQLVFLLAGVSAGAHSPNGMPALPTLQARPLMPASLPVATAAAAAPPLLQRQISLGNQQAAQQPGASAQNGMSDSAAAASCESLKAHATALKVRNVAPAAASVCAVLPHWASCCFYLASDRTSLEVATSNCAGTRGQS